jgi:uncharacterized protein with GYD domain
MPHFMLFANWTDDAAKTVKDIGKRYDAVQSLVASLGGKTVGAYVTTGQYDVVQILDMPDGEAMAKFALALSSRGSVRTTTVRAFTPQEIIKLAASVP